MTAIDIRGISKRFAQVVAADGVSLQIVTGERLVFLGRSGAGKTTLLRLIAGLIAPDSGSILVGGHEVSKLPPPARSIAFVSQDYALYPQLTVEQNLVASLASSELEKSERQARIADTLELFEITSLRDRLPAQLSGGQAQRAAFARAVVRRPAVLLLDEPLSQVDSTLKHECRALILSLSERLDTTVVMVTHDPLDAMLLATRIATVDQGRLLQVAVPREIYHSPNSRISAELLSPFGMNWLSAREFDLSKLDLPAQQTVKVIGIRPEHIHRCVDRSAGDAHIAFEAHVTEVSYLGFASLGTAFVGSNSLKILDPTHQLTPGQLRFCVARGDCVWLDPS
jgi:ABC-type sugar transport system ATPase subunit